jgi:hypothetical protein
VQILPASKEAVAEIADASENVSSIPCRRYKTSKESMPDLMLEEIDPESAQIREVYARFGLAMYQSQCVEREVAILLATEYGPGIKAITQAQYSELLESLFRNTLGGLITKLIKSGQIDSNFESTLRKALTQRNWLAHNYFWERAPHFLDEKSRIA